MPFKTNSKKDYTPTDALPLHLAHKPMYALPYEHFDGIYTDGTDARYISVGMAQYDESHVSIKVLRHTGTKWTRQSEELPLHRVLDMTLFLAKVLYDSKNGQLNIPPETYERQEREMTIAAEQRGVTERNKFEKFKEDNSEILKKRFNALFSVLTQLKKKGAF